MPDPISARDTRYQSAVRIQEQPRICLSRFSWIWDRRREATAGSPVVYEGESKVDWCGQSAACYLVGLLFRRTYWQLMASFAVKGFVLFWTKLGLYYHWKRSSLRRRGQEKVSLSPHLSSPRLTFFSTRHRDLYQVRWFDDSDIWHVSRGRYQSPKCGEICGREIQKTIVRV